VRPALDDVTPIGASALEQCKVSIVDQADQVGRDHSQVSEVKAVEQSAQLIVPVDLGEVRRRGGDATL